MVISAPRNRVASARPGSPCHPPPEKVGGERGSDAVGRIGGGTARDHDETTATGTSGFGEQDGSRGDESFCTSGSRRGRAAPGPGAATGRRLPRRRARRRRPGSAAMDSSDTATPRAPSRILEVTLRHFPSVSATGAGLGHDRQGTRPVRARSRPPPAGRPARARKRASPLEEGGVAGENEYR